jgi:dienelactone hydrolase
MTVVKQFWVVPIVLLLLTTPSMAEKKEVTIPGAGGVNLKGTLYLSSKPGPGVVVLHECNADRQVYNNLGTMLSTAGYNVLAFDFRMDSMPADVDAAFGFLTSQSLVNTRALGIVAGSCGVNEAVHASQRHPDVRTLVVLSGGTDAAGEAYIKDLPKLSIFGAASEEDTEAAAAVKKLVEVSSNNYKQVEMFKGAGHAASMFEKQPDLEADIVIWFRSNLPVGGYGLPPAIK